MIELDQKRFVLQKGEYIAGQKQKSAWKAGGCTRTGLVEKLANGRHNQSYVFDLGLYE